MAEVEWKTLGEIGLRNSGTSITAAKMQILHTEGAPVKIFAGGNTVASVAFDALPARDIITEPSIIVKSRGYIGFEYCDKPFSHKSELWSYTILNPNIISKFVYYYLLTKTENLQQRAKSKSVKIPQLAVCDTDMLEIPLPPVEKQRKIVDALDKFTSLTASLTAEKELRVKQYHYYRDSLLTFKQGAGADCVKWASLDDVCSAISAGGDLPDNFAKGQISPSSEFPYPIYSNGTAEKSLYGFTDNYKIDKEAVTISARGTIGWHTVRQAKFTPIVRLIVLIPNLELISAKFLNYILDLTEIGHSGGSIPQLTVPNVKKLKIPLPSLAEQKRIVAILDKFDSYVNDISCGLPAEIAARQKQYEYYRNKLLSFDSH